MIFGADISSHQGGNIDFRAVSADMDFVISKATEGADFSDSRFATNWAGTRAAGMAPGAYHFARYDLRTGRDGGEKEGRWFVQHVKAVGGWQAGAMPPYADIEKYAEAADFGVASVVPGNIEFLRGFVDVVDNELGRQCGIYTGKNVWKFQFGGTDEFSDRSLWQVSYSSNGGNAGTAPPSMGVDWQWDLWQWSGGGAYSYYEPLFGAVQGVPNPIDVNRVRGGLDGLRRLTRGGGGTGGLFAAAALMGATGYFMLKKT